MLTLKARLEVLVIFYPSLPLSETLQMSDAVRIPYLNSQFACQNSGGAPLPEAMDGCIRP